MPNPKEIGKIGSSAARECDFFRQTNRQTVVAVESTFESPYRERAARWRRMAETTRHPGLRISYLEIAEAYERLAAVGQAPADPPAENSRDDN